MPTPLVLVITAEALAENSRAKVFEPTKAFTSLPVKVRVRSAGAESWFRVWVTSKLSLGLDIVREKFRENVGAIVPETPAGNIEAGTFKVADPWTSCVTVLTPRPP